jgi:putative MATE family efflux protein
MGVAGAGLATIISQALSAVLVIRVMMRTEDMHRFEPKLLKLDQRMLTRIVKIGFPAGLQSVMYSLSNIIIQSSVNSLGTDTVAAWTAYSKIDSIFWMIVGAFGISITTFVGQNFGAGKFDRVRKGVLQCWLMCAATTVLLSTILYNFGVYCYQLFTGDPIVIEIGIQILRFLVPCYILFITIEIFSGTLRGVGDCWVPTVICLMGVCVIRVIWNMVVVPMNRTLYTVAFSYPMTWAVTSIAFAVYYFKFSQLGKRRK